MSDTPSPSSPSWSSRVPRWAWGSTSVVLVLALVCGLSFVLGTRAASSYVEDWEAWKRDAVPSMQAAVETPKGLYAEDGARLADRQRQRAACTSVGRSRSELRATLRGMPALGAGGVGALSGRRRDLAETAGKRERVIRTFVKEADVALAKVERDCRWTVRVMTDPRSVRGPSALKAAEGMLEKKGAESGLKYCPTGDCVPLDPGRLVRYFRLVADGQEAESGWRRAAFSGKECRATTYGSMCRRVLAAQGRVEPEARRCIREARRATDARHEVARVSCNRVARLRDSTVKRLSSPFADRWPDLRSSDYTRVVDLPNRFLALMATQHLADVRDRAAFSFDRL